MTTILYGHGEREGEAKTFVPEGVTIKWYANVNEDLLTTNGFLAINSGNFDSPTEKQGPGAGKTVETFNLKVYPYLDNAGWVYLLNEKSNHVLKFVGVDVGEGNLCNDLFGCKVNGVHSCDGVFGKATTEWKTDGDLILLVCRGLKGSPKTITQKLGSKDDEDQPAFKKQLGDFFDNLCVIASNNPGDAEEKYDCLDADWAIYSTGHKRIQTWLAIRWAADYGSKGQISDLFKQLDGHLNDENQPERFLNARKYRKGFGAAVKAKPEEFSRRSTAGAALW